MLNKMLPNDVSCDADEIVSEIESNDNCYLSEECPSKCLMR